MAVKWKWNNNTGGGNVPADLANRVQTLETDNTQNKTNITNLQNDTVKLSGAQNISGVKTLTASGGEVLKLNSGTNNSAYIAGYKSGNSRIWYFGRGSSTNENFILGSTADIKIEPTGKVDLSNKKISFLADPAANQDATNKQYVDNRIKYRTIDTNINASSTYSVEPTAGYQVINVMVGRKRSNDGMYFFEYQTTLNKQVFWGSDNKIKIYNQGNVSGFSNNEFKILITEMKV